MLNNNQNINELKQQYRELSMIYQNDSNIINKLNNEYNDLIHNFSNIPTNNNNIEKLNHREQFMNKNLPLNMMNMVDMNQIPNLMYMPMNLPMNPEDEQEMMNIFMKSMPDLLNVAFDMKKKYNKKKNKNGDILSNFADFLNVYSNNDDYDDKFVEKDSNLNIKEIKNIEDIKILYEVSIEEINKEEKINISYDINFINNDISEKRSVIKEIILDNSINHKEERRYKNDGNIYLLENNENNYSDLIVCFIIKENKNKEISFNDIINKDNNTILYEKINYNYIIHLNITFKESLIGFKKNIKLFNGNEINININSNGRIIMNNNEKIINNKGFYNKKDDKYGDMIIKFYILPYFIENINDKKELIDKIFI